MSPCAVAARWSGFPVHAPRRMRYRSGLPCPALRQAALRQPDVRQQDIAVIQNDQYETVRYTLKNELTPWYRVQRGFRRCRRRLSWCRWKRGWISTVVVQCALSRDLHGRTTQSVAEPKRGCRAPRPRRFATCDYAYVRRGVCSLWLFVEPLGPWRTAQTIARRTAVDWTRQVQPLANHPNYR